MAEVAGRVRGYGVASQFTPPPDAPPEVAPPGFYLLGVIVAPEVRRRGLGEALVRARLEWVRARARECFYFADDDNVASIALHARAGFEPLRRRLWFPGLQDPQTPMTLYRAALAGASAPRRSP